MLLYKQIYIWAWAMRNTHSTENFIKGKEIHTENKALQGRKTWFG